MICHMQAIGKQTAFVLQECQLPLHGLLFFLYHGATTVSPVLRVLSGTEKMLNTYEVLGMHMRYE